MAKLERDVQKILHVFRKDSLMIIVVVVKAIRLGNVTLENTELPIP
jgi:hypothetical protein